MPKFQYVYLDVSGYDRRINCGFHFSLGDEWEDAIIYPLKREGKIFGKYKTLRLKKEWIEKFCSYINEQKQIKSLSSWIYKEGPHNTEHRFEIEGESWNTEIGIYDLGLVENHMHNDYKEEELILLKFFNDVQNILKEVNINLEKDNVSW